MGSHLRSLVRLLLYMKQFRFSRRIMLALQQMKQRFKSVFFDVGNTLAYADLAVTLHPLTKRGSHPTDAQLRNAEINARRSVDALYASGAQPNPDTEYWKSFFDGLLGSLGVQDTEVLSELTFEWRAARNWTRVLPGTAEVLQRLASKYDLAVISNADGTIGRLLKQVELARFFRTVTDSGIVGVHKPSPEVFHLALESMQTDPEESVYIGDSYSVDFLAARAIGMQAVLFDGSGSYTDLDVPKVNHLVQLEKLLTNL